MNASMSSLYFFIYGINSSCGIIVSIMESLEAGHDI
ncbi:hypothetical protein CBFG_03124 [Clostridiales bacterium 1_7_47FAA]|nr:hypothetical protein CBFG_03124 [Clostridiales bacterium 1_7_47FAA]